MCCIGWIDSFVSLEIITNKEIIRKYDHRSLYESMDMVYVFSIETNRRRPDGNEASNNES